MTAGEGRRKPSSSVEIDCVTVLGGEEGTN